MAKKKTALCLNLPTPPAAEDKLAAWSRRACAELGNQLADKRELVMGHVRVSLRCGIGGEGELATITGVVLQLLAIQKVIETAGKATDLQSRFDRIVEPGRIHVEVARSVPPLRRIGALGRQRVSEVTTARWAEARAAKVSHA